MGLRVCTATGLRPVATATSRGKATASGKQPPNWISRPMVYALLAGRWVIGLLLLTAGISKLGSRQWSAEVIQRYEIVPTRFARSIATVLPWMEGAIGLALLVGLVPAITGWWASALLLGFAVVIAVNVVRGRSFDCGCGDAVERPIGWPLAIRNAFLAAIGAAAALGPAGLSLWTGSLNAAPVAASNANLVPVPLTVVAVFGVARCLQSVLAEGRRIESAETARRRISLWPRT